MGDLEERINAWHDQIANMTPENLEARRDVELVIAKLDDGQLRVAEVAPSGEVIVHDWVKKAIMLLFRLHGLEKSEAGPFEYLDKLELKYDYERRGVRVVPGASARRGSFLSPGVILMPSFVNIGAWVGPGTMVDTWATVGSCAQIGANVHLAGGVGIGGRRGMAIRPRRRRQRQKPRPRPWRRVAVRRPKRRRRRYEPNMRRGAPPEARLPLDTRK